MKFQTVARHLRDAFRNAECRVARTARDVPPEAAMRSWWFFGSAPRDTRATPPGGQGAPWLAHRHRIGKAELIYGEAGDTVFRRERAARHARNASVRRKGAVASRSALHR